jgi:hypothetical protein
VSGSWGKEVGDNTDRKLKVPCTVAQKGYEFPSSSEMLKELLPSPVLQTPQ